MPSKIISIPDIGDVVISKRRGQRSIRIAINGSKIKVTQPTWLPFSAGESFALRKAAWIAEHLREDELYSDSQQIGIGHTLKLAKGVDYSRRITNSTILVTYPRALTSGASDVQAYIATTIQKALRRQAEQYLPQRAQQLADMFGFQFNTVNIRLLTRRWGSCNSKKEITFNLKLMELDALHIDYVILHELTHTLYMNHGAEFWAHMEKVMPNAKKIAKAVRHYQA